MNRKQRRAAVARKAASTTPAEDIVQLFAAANVAHQQRRFAEAELICKQILARIPTHARCSNLLGVVYQSSGRHRLAIKLFAKAISLDDLDAGFHYNIAGSHQAMGKQMAAADHFKAAITLGMGGEKKELEEFLLENPTLLRCIDRITSRLRPLDNEILLGMNDVEAIAQDILLRCALELTIIRSAALELLLTQLRLRFLSLSADNPSGAGQIGDDVMRLLFSLSQQCFINEYVFALTDKEIEQATKLRDILSKRLSIGEDISPLLLAVVAAYFPLHSIPEAASLLSLEWPEYAAHLLRQQVSEPLEEMTDRPNIPTLTEIDDPTSIAVMQQYEENPYPRWQMNPAKVLAGDMKRHAQAGAGGEPRGQDILIAGCGTGQHAFITAQCYPNARILAVDISRTSLAYARRKTREEGLKNIEYAQADILKLGSLGRAFDRIEAAGVLHHLADPKAGLRILLSLLAQNGIMRIGLYSETARRAVVRARALINERGILPTAENIRALRQTIIRTKNNQQWDTVLKSGDFYSTSGCRDFLFNVMEHRFTIPAIAALLNEYELSFRGFELEASTLKAFQQQYPGATALTNLEHWEAFEAANPNTFREMYVFTVQKSQ